MMDDFNEYELQIIYISYFSLCIGVAYYFTLWARAVRTTLV